MEKYNRKFVSTNYNLHFQLRSMGACPRRYVNPFRGGRGFLSFLNFFHATLDRGNNGSLSMPLFGWFHFEDPFSHFFELTKNVFFRLCGFEDENHSEQVPKVWPNELI